MKQYAVITGASSGIGRAFAKQLSRQGYALILISRREKHLQNLAAQLWSECIVLPADLTSLEECRRVYEYIRDKNIEIFINNAGFGDCGPFIVADLDKELQMIHLNVRAMHFFTKRILQLMQKKDRGYLLNVASSAGLIPAGPYMADLLCHKSLHYKLHARDSSRAKRMPQQRIYRLSVSWSSRYKF